MASAIEFVLAIVDNAILAKARKKIPGLNWGHGRILRGEEACIMGIAALAACEPKETLQRSTYYLGQTVLNRRGWGGQNRRMKTPCPACGAQRGVYAQSAVSHANDYHGAGSLRPLAKTRSILRRWVKQEQAAE